MKTLFKALSTSALILISGLTMATPQTSELDDPYISYYRTFYGPDAVGEPLAEVVNPQTSELDGPCISYYRTFYGPDAVGEPLAEVETPQTSELDGPYISYYRNFYGPDAVGEPLVSVITIINVVMFTLFDGVSGDAQRECSDRALCRSWC
ncbi:MAG: hypothetical protein JMN25_18460 [gamma proteobacterium endosymbiont of Lamellibrachia anaximandri]|nr:hypothetical protein [gamma proteobacterium endosymbiont of Lamellibrachia anaximandri]